MLTLEPLSTSSWHKQKWELCCLRRLELLRRPIPYEKKTTQIKHTHIHISIRTEVQLWMRPFHSFLTFPKMVTSMRACLLSCFEKGNSLDSCNVTLRRSDHREWKRGQTVFFFIAKVISKGNTCLFFFKVPCLKKTKDTKYTVIHMVHTPAEFCILDSA